MSVELEKKALSTDLHCDVDANLLVGTIATPYTPVQARMKYRIETSRESVVMKKSPQALDEC